MLALSLAAFALIVGLALLDLLADVAEGTTAGHLVAEGLVVFVGTLGGAALAYRLRTTVRRARVATETAARLTEELAVSAAAADHYRREAAELMAGLAWAIDAQFDRWRLSPAEKEVGLLLLKGLSHREIAAARQVTEATARQQAGAVYRKAGLSGRADLAAFFLEDLMLPPAGT